MENTIETYKNSSEEVYSKVGENEIALKEAIEIIDNRSGERILVDKITVDFSGGKRRNDLQYELEDIVSSAIANAQIQLVSIRQATFYKLGIDTSKIEENEQKERENTAKLSIQSHVEQQNAMFTLVRNAGQYSKIRKQIIRRFPEFVKFEGNPAASQHIDLLEESRQMDYVLAEIIKRFLLRGLL